MAMGGFHRALTDINGVFVYFRWDRTSYEITNEKSSTTISWSLTIERSYSSEEWVESIQPYTVIVNGKTYAGNAYFSLDASTNKYTLTSGTDTIIHNTDGTGSCPYSFEFTSKKAGTASGSGVLNLDTLARPVKISTAENFTDEENPRITYKNYTPELLEELQACISLTGSIDDIAYRDITNTGPDGYYTFNLTDTERATLRNAINSGNESLQVSFFIRTKINGNYYHVDVNRVMTLINHEPTLNPTVQDVNSTTTALTGNSNKFIKYFSDASFNTGAAAKKGATIEFQTITCGSTFLDDYTSNTGTISGIDSNTFYLSVTDSRGFITRGFKVVDLIPYVKLTSVLTLSPLTMSGELSLNISGNYYNGSFGAEDNYLNLKYELDEDGQTIGTFGISSSITFTDNRYSVKHLVTGLDPQKTYTVRVIATDALMSGITSNQESVTSTPIFDWGKENFKHNTDVYLHENHAIRVKDDYYDKEVLNPLDENGRVRLGYGNYRESSGDTNIYGNNLKLYMNEKVFINDTELDYIVEQRSNGTWFYKKWSSGRIELFGYQNIENIPCNNNLGGWYRTAVQAAPVFPVDVLNPKVIFSYESDGTGALVWPTTRSSETAPSDYYLIRPTTSSSISGVVNFFVEGTWK